MSFRFSGSYRVAATEEACQQSLPSEYLSCVVKFLDDTRETFNLDRKADGQQLLDIVFDYLELAERHYFGLLYMESGVENICWLDGGKKIRKQFRDMPLTFYFRVKFYLSDPCTLQEEYTRYHFFMQLKLDILEGRLSCPLDVAALLASYAIQSELGDFHADDHLSGYVSVFRFIPNQTQTFEEDVALLHPRHYGMTPAESEYQYLKTVKDLEQYGCLIYDAMDKKNEVQLGISAVGLLIFKNFRRIGVYQWINIVKISFKRKQFIVQFRKDFVDSLQRQTTKTSTTQSSDSDFLFNCNVIVMTLSSARLCKNLWKCCVEYHTFFRLHKPLPSSASRTLLPAVVGGSRFRFTGRTQYQTQDDLRRRARVERTFSRAPSRRFARRPGGGSSQEFLSTSVERHAIDSSRYYNSLPLPRTSHNVRTAAVAAAAVQAYSEDRIKMNGSAALLGVTSPSSDQTPTPLLVSSVSALQQSRLAGGSMTSCSNKTKSFEEEDRTVFRPREGSARSASSSQLNVQTTKQQLVTESNTSAEAQRPFRRSAHRASAAATSVTASAPAPPVSAYSTLPRQAKLRGAVHHQSSTSEQVPPSTVDSRLSQSSSRCSLTSSLMNNAPLDVNAPQKLTFLSTAAEITRTSELLLSRNIDLLTNNCVNTNNNVNSHTKLQEEIEKTRSSEDGLVTIKMFPDESGRFGFNVKGGYDSNQNIIVSKVAANMPADVCIPRLNEGDQVLFINGRDVSTHTHEQVVQFIRYAAERRSKELVLVVRPAMYLADDESLTGPSSGDVHVSISTFPYSSLENTALLLDPPVTSNLTYSTDQLKDSINELRVSLTKDSLMMAFERLYRKKSGLSMNVARLPENVVKNRYRDISPYDETRVKITLKDNDYINASFVNMNIPGSSFVCRYIAAQGPLPNTSLDFWLMCWEQQTFLVVMLTANTERGRTKCHQYWPDLYETFELGGVTLTCVREQITEHFAFREFILSRNNVERRISHMQYISWPDHGVPPEPRDFIQFVQKVRHARAARVEPVVVHCSAGIGRTGVLIAMETAMYLAMANQAVCPLDLVREMRDQRAMLIQTTAQFRFVCETIVRAYEENICQ